jgi:hypothetical protein
LERKAVRTLRVPSSHATRGSIDLSGFNRIRNPKKRWPRRIKTDRLLMKVLDAHGGFD